MAWQWVAIDRPATYCLVVPSTGGQDQKRAVESAVAGVDSAEVVLTLHRLSRALQRLLIAQARANGLGMLEFLVLARAAEGDGITPGDAGRSLGLNTSTMSGLSDRLEADNLVQRYPHPTDRRLILLRATSKGRRLRERTLGPIFAALTREASALDAAAREEANRFLERVTAVVSEHADGLDRSRAPMSARAATPRRPRAVGAARATKFDEEREA